MTTPICDFVKKYAESNSLRLHMPGHKGIGSLGIERLDLTEIEGADVLYSANGIIAESQENARELFGSGKTLYSTEGSSLSIRTMLYLALLWGKSRGRDSLILAGRNAHRVFHSAAALLDLDIRWLMGEDESLISCSITPEALDKELSECKRKPFAIYLTSPDYLGNMLNVEELSRVADRHGCLCLVDNAHGAYLRFLDRSQHPISLGAHMCADSAHKTLPALTGAGYLHISKNAPRLLSDEAEGAMTLFASTSPSYLILQSLDAANAYLSVGYREQLANLCRRISELKSELCETGYRFIGNEPIKLTVDAKSYGYLGTELAEILGRNGIICEHSDRDILVLMLTPEIGEEGLKRLRDTLVSIEKRAPIKEKAPKIGRRIAACTVREAVFSPKERISVNNAVGKILAELSVSCPPAIPIVACGEVIDDNAVELFRYYGTESVSVIKE